MSTKYKEKTPTVPCTALFSLRKLSMKLIESGNVGKGGKKRELKGYLTLEGRTPKTGNMIDINKLFGKDKQEAVAFYNEEHDLTPDQRQELSQFFEGTYKTTTVAKSFMGIAAGLTMVWLARRKRRISPLYAMLGGIGLSAFVFSYMTPTIYENKVNELEKRFGNNSKILKVVKVTPQGAEYSYFWQEYFNNSILDDTIRLKDPTREVGNSGEAGVEKESAWQKLRDEEAAQNK